MDNKKRGNYLVSLRKRKGLTQLEVADLLHFTDKNISKWENGKSFPSDPKVLSDIAELFEVPVENIIYGEDNAIDKINELALKKVNFKIIKTYLSIALFLSLILFCIINKYDNYYVAKISSKSIIDSSVFIILTKDYNSLKFKKLVSNNKDIKLVSFYYEKNNQKYLLFETENEDLIITEYSYYLEYDFEKIVKNDCYIKILYSDETDEVYKIKFNKYLSSLFT